MKKVYIFLTPFFKFILSSLSYPEFSCRCSPVITVLSKHPCLGFYWLSCSGGPLLSFLFRFRGLSFLFWLASAGFLHLVHGLVLALLFCRPDLAVLFWLSSCSIHCPALAVIFCSSCSAFTVLPVLFWVSCHSYPLLLSWSGCPRLVVLIWCFVPAVLFGCHVLAVLMWEFLFFPESVQKVVWYSAEFSIQHSARRGGGGNTCSKNSLAEVFTKVSRSYRKC
jgi:hypothetical protein